MKFATSIRLSGELVSAEKCNYKSFSDLNLICPYCKNSVYLVGEHGRSSTVRQLRTGRIVPVREATVSTHFTHHIKDINFSVCEKKDSQVNSQTLIHRTTVARLQRARLFKASFWELFCSNQYLEMLFSELKQAKFDKYVAEAQNNTHLAFYSGVINDTILIEMTAKNPSIARTEQELLFRERANFPHLKAIAKLVWSEPLKNLNDFDAQYMFVEEVLLFLYAPQNKKMLRKCLTALILSLYSIYFFQVINSFPNAYLSGKLDPIIRSKIICQTQDNTMAFLAQANLIKIQNLESPFNISTLGMTLLVALLSIDLEAGIKKYAS